MWIDFEKTDENDKRVDQWKEDGVYPNNQPL